LPKKNPLTSILYSNRSACFFAQEEWQKTVDDATKALDIDPNYTKALFRRATAYEHLKDYVKALAGKALLSICLRSLLTSSMISPLADFKKYVELDPSPHPAAKRAVKYLPPLAQKQEEEERAKMMEDLKGLGNKFLGLFGMSIDNFEAKQDPATGSYSIQFNPNPTKQ
jgi:tetratricopeptide (TPR) repeat protein